MTGDVRRINNSSFIGRRCSGDRRRMNRDASGTSRGGVWRLEEVDLHRMPVSLCVPASGTCQAVRCRKETVLTLRCGFRQMPRFKSVTTLPPLVGSKETVRLYRRCFSSSCQWFSICSMQQTCHMERIADLFQTDTDSRPLYGVGVVVCDVPSKTTGIVQSVSDEKHLPCQNSVLATVMHQPSLIYCHYSYCSICS